MKEHVVIIGGGFGGLYAAKRLKNAPVNVTLIDRRNHHLFQPLLYQVATGELSPADIATPLRRLLKGQKNAKVVLGEVTGFDVENRAVLLHDEVIHYDRLIVAAGAGNHYFGKNEWARWAPSLKTVEDATEIRRRVLGAFEAAERATDPDKIRAWLTFAVIGGGPTGVELAGALAEVAHETLKHDFRSIDPSQARIVLIQSPDRVLPMYAPELSAKAEAALARLGVEVVTGTRVTDVGPDGLRVSHEGHEDEIAARTILWAAGVQASPLGKALADATGASTDRGGRIPVEPDLSVPGHPEIHVIGDMASYAHQTGTPLPGVAQVAIQQGRYMGDLIRRRVQGGDLPPFRYRDPGSVATIGRGKAVAEIGRFRLAGWLAWNLWMVIHLMYQMDLENRVLVLVQWMWNFTTRGRSALLITERETPFAGIRATAEIGLKTLRETATLSRVRETNTMRRAG
ncbi:MAG TPA: NAD(P)/FAD-dependent oxidoreductase [Aggregatilinea sp.]|uniref:NAD(P)/FAD-dependent oxidoreductase n=1 Tax=Aggregatilinea sp. TaxID=2806333 RepID=UPI002C64C7A7|nr:NAD(P)/FAD-dependent oxidoreductase [Aggregatilinea sp.]HML24635.1 NAD(P)/FAD-dependent oxidoreductase [Aggregatilinea sp.]